MNGVFQWGRNPRKGLGGELIALRVFCGVRCPGWGSGTVQAGEDHITHALLKAFKADLNDVIRLLTL